MVYFAVIICIFNVLAEIDEKMNELNLVYMQVVEVFV